MFAWKGLASHIGPGIPAPDTLLEPDALPMLERFAWVLPSDETGVALDCGALAGSMRETTDTPACACASVERHSGK